MSDIFKKITSIEPVDDDALDALNIKPSDKTPRKSFLRPLEDDDPVPAFITREGDRNTAQETAVKDTPLAKETANTQTPPPDNYNDSYQTAAQVAVTATSVADSSPPTGWMKWVGLIAVIAWLGASFAYMYGFFDLGRKWTELTPIQIAGLVLAVLLPALLLGLLFFTLRQLANFSAQSHDLIRAAHTLSTPDDSVVAKTAIMSKAVKTEIDSIDARIDQALARMGNLETVLKDQTHELTLATAATTQTADEISGRLSTQRLALEQIAGTFDDRMAMLSSTLDEQSSKLEASTQLAEHKIQEARVSIDGAAEKINAASDVVKGNTVEAASTLTKSQEEIEGLAEMIRARSAELDEVYRKHAKDLTAMIAELRDEQQDMSISLEERLVKMRDMSLSAKVSAESLTEASQAGKVTVQALAEATRLTDTAVKQRFADMEQMVKFSSDKAESISDQAARRVQDSLGQTRKEIARIENDMVALQARLNSPRTAENVPLEGLPLEIPEQPKAAKRKRIRLKPLEEDFPPVEPPRIPDESPSSLNLRAAPTPDTVFKPYEAAPDDIRSIARPDDEALELLEELTIEVEPLDLTTDMTPIDENADITSFEPVEDLRPKSETLRPTAPPMSEEVVGFGKRKTKATKPKTGWRWRDMLGGLERPDDAMPSDEAPHPMVAPLPREISDQRMIASLSALGLAPSAIIDDGCIIEAANTRKAKGAMAMSAAVALRMGEAVRHLHLAIGQNGALETDARTYVAQYQSRLSLIEQDREAIRTALESDGGRAFLLCDAALNG